MTRSGPVRPAKNSVRRRRRVIIFAITFAIIYTALPHPWVASADAQERFSSAPLSILSAGKTHHFTVEIAMNRAQRAQGLMWRRSLKPDRGMLFVYQSERIIQMWMKNTLIPLDILFIDREGSIVHIKERAVPRSLRVISSSQRARGVLELRGGMVSRLGLRPGDKVMTKALGNSFAAPKAPKN